MDIRIGFGYDTHAFTGGNTVVLAGIQIPHTKMLLGHSDADVLTHAIIDSLFGALALGDIGSHFSDNDSKYKGINSTSLLKQAIDIVNEKGYKLGNLDCTVCAERPKLRNYIDSIRFSLSALFCVDSDRISVKATTQEKLGFVGREEGMSAYAVCTVIKI